ncbi:hypothetical protein AND_006836 [Anopheles darlingi]|uniref:ZAD domain-containing protein n=1 Tax=Anopheles darlingi TaxID=43151 RepID=W5JBX3_ANODA|nr:hypothetical protein AND_006836 [Anopheles darlingi]
MANVVDGRPSNDGTLFHINLDGSSGLAESEYAIRFGCCRLCCNDESNLRELFPGGYRDEVLLRKIVACTTVQIEYSDDEDALICFACVSKIEEFYQYREQCRTNDVLQRNWKRRLARSIEPAQSTLIPVDSIKQEKTTELDSFYDSAVQYEDHELDDATEFQSSSGLRVLDSSEPHATTSYQLSNNARPLHNLLEPMDDPADEFFDYKGSDENYEGSDDGTYSQVHVKQELDLEDDIDKRLYVTSDDEMQHDPDDHTTTMAPEKNARDTLQKHRLLKSKSGKQYMFCEGFLFSQRAPAAATGTGAVHNGQVWHCLGLDCESMLEQNNQTGMVAVRRQHNHHNPVTKNATVRTILRYLSGFEATIRLNKSRTSQITGGQGTDPGVASSTNEYRFVVNMRNGTSIVHNGFQYSMKHRRMDGTTYWKCRVNGGTCEAGIFLTPSKTIETIGRHNHDGQYGSMNPRRRNRSRTDQRNDDDEDEADEEDGYDEVEEDARDASGQHELADQSEDIDLSAYLTSHMNADLEQQEPTVPVEIPSGDEAKPAGKSSKPTGVAGSLRRGYNFQIVRNVNQKLRLLFDGCLYEKENQREDGAIIWRCRRNYDRCNAQAIQHQHGLVEILGTHEHDQVRQKRVNLLSTTGSFAYRHLRTANGREQLVYDGFRYQRRCVNGKMTDRWRCVNSGTDCRAMVVMAADGLVYTLQSQTHCHGPTEKKSQRPETKESEIAVIKQPLVSIRPLNILKATDRLRTKTPSPKNLAGHVTRIIPAMARRYGYRLIKNKKGNEGLVHRGYRYCKRLVRPDGTIKWYCRMNSKTCNARLTMAPNGSLVFDGTIHHNHSPTEEISKDPTAKVVKNGQRRRVYTLDEKTFTESEWYFVKNTKNGESLVHAGYRYTRKGDRVDKSSFWRCSQRTQGCWAGIILFPDETIAKASGHEHCHPPTEQNPQHSGAAATSPWTTNDDAGSDLSDQDDKPKLSDATEHRTIIPKAEAAYRVVKNRLNTNSILFRGGRFVHRGQRSDGSVAWICNMNKTQCRAAFKIHTNGGLEIVNEHHNHPLAPEEDAVSQEEEEKEDEKDEKKPSGGTEGDQTDDQEYYYSINRINRECLVYDHCRYGKSGTRADGSVMWRCGMNGNTCLARVCVDVNGKLTHYSEYTHNHRPLEELPPVVRLPDQATDSGPVSSTTTLTPKTVNTKPVIKGSILSWNHHRYRKMPTVQADGSSVWACTTSDYCSAKVKTVTQEGGKMKVQSMYSHNHDPPDQQQQQQRECDELFELYRTPRGRLALLYEGYRYSLQTERMDGQSTWRCYAKKHCRAAVVVSVDGTSVTRTKDEHIHSKNADGVAGVRLTLGRKPGTFQELVKRFFTHRIIPSVESVEEERTPVTPSPVSTQLTNNQPASSSSSRKPLTYTDCGEYGFEQNNKGQKRLVYEGRRYYLGYTLSNGVNVWRCAYRKPLKCGALLRVTKKGKILPSPDNDHNHSVDMTSVAESNGRSSAAASSNSSRAMSQQELETAGEEESCAEDEKKGNTDSGSYRFVRTADDQTDVLIYKEERFLSTGSQRASDHATLWRCARASTSNDGTGCRAMVYMLPSGRLSEDTIRNTSSCRHNHDVQPAPPAPLYREKIDPAGTRDFQFEGRFGRTIRCQNFRYQRTWERKDGLEYYRCIGFQPHGCRMMMKLSADKILTHHRGEVHSHPPCAPGSASVPNSPLTGSAAPSSPVATKRKSLAASKLADGTTAVYKDYVMLKKPRGSTLQHHGYEYWTHSRLANGTVSYRCRMQFKLKCFATVSIDSHTGLLTMRNDLSHNHPPTDETYVPAEQNAEVEEVDEVEEIEEEEKVVSIDVSDKNVAQVSSERVSLHLRMLEIGNRKAKENSSSSTDEEQNDDDEEEAREELDSSNSNGAVVAAGRTGNYMKKTKKYSFIKVSQYKRCLLYEDYFYDFDKELPDGSKRYVCSRFTATNACKASVVLLMPSGRLLVSALSIEHTHRPPGSAFILRNIGRGSRHFEITESKLGRSLLLYEGQRYQTPRSKPDGSVIWSCQELIGQNKRCYVSQEILPNGRAAPPSDREHQHPPWQPQRSLAPRASSVEAATVPSSPTKILLHAGYRYEYGRKCADNSILWLCSRRPDCQASIYRLANGGILNGMKTEHTHRPDVVSGTETSQQQQQQQSATSLTAVDRLRIASNATRRFSYPTPRAAATSTGTKTRNTIGAMCYKGYRYWHNRTQADGIQYWRCCKRQKQRCLVTLQVLPDGMIVDDRNHTHTHRSEEQESPSEQEQQQSKDLARKKKEDEEEEEEEEVVAPQTTRFGGYRLYRSNLRSDGSAIYQCRRDANCPYQVLRLANGEMVARTDASHNCDATQTSDNDGNQHASAVDKTSNSRSGPESGHPKQSGDDRADSSMLGPSVKRIRLVANFEQQPLNEDSIDKLGEMSDNDDNEAELVQLSSNNNHDDAKVVIAAEQDDDDDSHFSIPADDPQYALEAIEQDQMNDEAAVAVSSANEHENSIEVDANENTEEPDWNRQDHNDKEENVLDPGKLVEDTLM